MKIVTGYTGESHISSNDDQGRNQGIFGRGSYVLNVGNKLGATIATTNTIRISDGEGVMQGVHFRIEPGTYDTVTIESGQNNKRRWDLIVARYQKNQTTGIESVTLEVIKGTAVDLAETPTIPSYNTGNILTGSLLVDMPLWVVKLYGVNIEGVAKQFVTNVSPFDFIKLADYAGGQFSAPGGTYNDSYGGCYYYVKGNRVTVHIGLKGLTANTSYQTSSLSTPWYLPEQLRPKYETVARGHGGGMSYDCVATVGTNGSIGVRSSYTYALVEVSYDLYE